MVENKVRPAHTVMLALLALIFTIALTFASVELPRLIDEFIGKNVDIVDVATMPKDHPDYNPDDLRHVKTELWFKTYHLRWIGYGCLAVIVILIVIGFVFNKSGLSAVGAIILFLPVFGHFALTMFFLGGLGFLRLLWMPFLDVSFNVMRLGEIVALPYKWASFLYNLTGLQKWLPLSYLITGIGLLLFFLGVLTWFYTYYQKKGVADFWIYRICRHPQYLGWIIWSYGIMFIPLKHSIKKYYGISNTLPWLLAAMVIIGVAFMEELKMKRLHGKTYENYRGKTSFIFPLPRSVSKLFYWPVRVFFRKWFPERKREVFLLLLCYTVILMTVSAFYAGMIQPSAKAVSGPVEEDIPALVNIVETHENAGERRYALGKLGRIGAPAVEVLIPFLDHEDPMIRWNTASALGNTGSEKAVDPLIRSLSDPHGTVRGSAAVALGAIGSRRAVEPLVNAFWDTKRGLAGPAAGALGRIGDRSVVSELERAIDEMEGFPYLKIGYALQSLGSKRAEECFMIGIRSENQFTRSACVAALGKMSGMNAQDQVISALKDPSERVRRTAAVALMENPSSRSFEALGAALEDEDFEVRMYAKEALNRIEKLVRSGEIK